MSRIGKKLIQIPDGVTINISDGNFECNGAQGKVNFEIPRKIKVEVKDNQIEVTRTNSDKETRAMHGTARQLIQNIIIGTSKGFERILEVIGVGYRVAIEGNDLVLYVGYSHPVKMAIPEDLNAKVEKNKITISGIDKQRVGQFAANIREVRKPEPYKGKGIKYSDEVIKRKAGKAAKASK